MRQRIYALPEIADTFAANGQSGSMGMAAEGMQELAAFLEGGKKMEILDGAG